MNPILLAALADAYTQAGQPLTALELLGTQGEVGDPVVLRAKGRAERRAGRSAAAVATFRKVVDAAPQSAQALVELGEAIEDSGDSAGALRLYDQAAKLDPANVAARVGQAYGALVSLRVPIQQDAAYGRVIDQVNAVLKQYPTAPRVDQLQAIALMVGNQASLAAERLAAIYARSQGAEDVLLLSRAHLLAGEHTATLAVLRDHLARYPQDVRVRWDLAMRYRFLEDWPAAAKQLGEIVSQDWGRADAHLELAWALIKVGRKADAEPHLRVAEKAFPNDARVKQMQGLVQH